MAIKELKTIVALRREALNDYNSQAILRKGELAFVDLPSGEIKIKVGDGTTIFSELEYVDRHLELEIKSSIVRGYYRDGEFYANQSGSEKFVPKEYKIYINIPSKKPYIYNGSSYELLFPEIHASETEAGIAKLYNKLGENSDGAITQSCTTRNLNKKVEMTIGEDNETLVLSAINI